MCSSDLPFAVLKRIKEAVFRGRVRLHEFFSDFDPLRAGVVSTAKFRTALDASGLVAAVQLSDKELEVLAAYFSDPSDGKRVRYKDLLADVNTVFTQAGMERAPTATLTDFTPYLKASPPGLSQPESALVDDLLARMAHTVKVRGLLVRPFFHDYCRNVNSPIQMDQVTQVQFRNGLSRMGLQVTAEEAALLNKRFAGSADGHINYVDFACAVDPAMRTFSTREPRSYVEQPLLSGFRTSPLLDDSSDYQPGRPPTTTDVPSLPNSAAPPPALDVLLIKMQNKALQHRLRLGEFFKDFDKHRDGTITVPQFIKGISVAYDKMHMSLSEVETQLLVDHYSKVMVHGATHIQWRRLVADIEKVFTTAQMEKDPLSVTTNRVMQQDTVGLLPEKQEKVLSLIAMLRKRVEVRRVLVKPLFVDYEHQVNSAKVIDHITRQQMVQGFSRFGVELTEEEQALLMERYDTLGDGTVNYVALVRDIDPYECFSERKMRHHVFPQDPDYGSVTTFTGGFAKQRVVPGTIVNMQPGRPPTSNDQPAMIKPPSAELEKLLLALQATAVQHRLRVEESFKDFDRHRDGTITVPQFSIALSMTFSKHQPISQAEFELLVQAYGVDKPGVVHVQWKKCVDDINTIFNSKLDDLERNPAHDAPPSPAIIPRPVAKLDAMEEEQVAQTLARFRHLVNTRRILIKPFFQDGEFNRRSMRVVDHITKAQFAQCLSRLGLECNATELQLLQKKYDDKGDGFINYVHFTREVDAGERASDRNAFGKAEEISFFKNSGNFYATKVTDVQPGRSPPNADFPNLLHASTTPEQVVANLIARLQTKVIQYKIPVADFLVDYDKHKLGAISVAQFRRGLNFAFGDSYVREAISEEELLLLEQTYAKPMHDGAMYVDWRRFAADINISVITPHLEVQPTTQPAPRLIERQPVVLSSEEEKRVQRTLAEMRGRFRIRSVYAKAPFHDFAKSINSPMMVDHVTRQQFVQGLSQLGVEPSPDDLELLLKKYDDDGEGNVNYVNFARDVDPTETFSDRKQTEIGRAHV